MVKKEIYEDDDKLEVGEPKEDTKEDEVEDKKEGKEDEFEVIAGDDWDFPIELEGDITGATIILRITSEDYPNFLIEKENNEPVSNNMVIFSIKGDETEDIDSGEYKWSVSVVKDGKKKSSKPACFYVIKN